MRILTYCPIAPVTPKVYARSLQSIFRLDWDEPMPIVFGRNDSPQSHKYADLCAKYNEARRMVLAGDYDALFLVENDMILPEDALRKLAELDSDVAYGLYVNRHGRNRWLAFSRLDGYVGASLTQTPDMAKAHWGEPIETQGVGMGCTLIKRHVLEAIEFRTHPQHYVANDWLFSQDCIEQGYRQMHHLGVVCGHIANPRSPRILWPDPDAFGMYRVEMFDDSQLVRTKANEPLQIHVNGMGGETVLGLQR